MSRKCNLILWWVVVDVADSGVQPVVVVTVVLVWALVWLVEEDL